MKMETQPCTQCGGQIDAPALAGEYCSECAAKIRSELGLSFQVKNFLTLVSESSAHLPVVTLFLVALDVAVYCYIETNIYLGHGPAFVAVLEMHGASVIHGQWWRLLTYAFIHLRLLHLISNAVLLCLLGWVVEPMFGHAKLLLLWVISAIAGSIAQLFSRELESTSYGASGVVYGLVGALLCVYLSKQVILTSRARHRRIVLLVFFVGINFLGEWYVFRGPVPGHVGGLLAGLLFPFIQRPQRPSP
jgi:rhomboid protease GluP